jgi:hypothetical protein
MGLTDAQERKWHQPARLVQLLPAIAFLTTFGFFFVDKGREARTVLRSGRGLAVVAAIIGGYVLLAIATRRIARRAWAPPVVLAAAVVGLAAWTVLPYSVDERANRVLIGEPAVDSGAALRTTVPPPTGEGLDAGLTMTTLPSPVRVSAGTLVGIDHDASGVVSVIREPDGTTVVRFEDFRIEGTPDPQVYLVAGDDVRSPAGIHLGAMPGNNGEVLDVAVPDGTDAGVGWTVLVWCGRFSVPIASAAQEPI